MDITILFVVLSIISFICFVAVTVTFIMQNNKNRYFQEIMEDHNDFLIRNQTSLEKLQQDLEEKDSQPDYEKLNQKL